MNEIVVPRIEDSFEKLDEYPSVSDRYYTPYYHVKKEQEDQCILVHSNRICLITLAPTHPVIKEQKTIKKLDFQVSNKLDRLNNKVTGKGKKGGQFIQPQSLICFIDCSDGSKYSVLGCIKGKLIEINESLLTQPQLLVDKPMSEGFIAIILPNIKEIDTQKQNLMSEDEYKRLFTT